MPIFQLKPAKQFTRFAVHFVVVAKKIFWRGGLEIALFCFGQLSFPIELRWFLNVKPKCYEEEKNKIGKRKRCRQIDYAISMIQIVEMNSMQNAI